MPPIRSLLFVPGDSERKITKALDCAADALILDLEDSVTPDHKPAARELCRRPSRAVRGICRAEVLNQEVVRSC